MVIEDTEDLDTNAYSRRIYGLNQNGRVLREVFIDDPRVGQPSKYWCRSWTLDVVDDENIEAQLVAEERTPAAHNVSSDAEVATFLDPYDPFDKSWENDEQTLHEEEGLITVHAYEGVNRTDTRVKKGRGKEGEEQDQFLVGAWEYLASSDPFHRHLVTTSYDFPTETTEKEEGTPTNFTHHFFENGMVSQIETELPVISENGSDDSTKTHVYYDTQGKLRWTKDGEGYVNYYSYHTETGQLAYVVEDADPASLPSSANSNPDKWITS